MCKIRIVVLDKSKEIEKDYILEFDDIQINIIDRPSFCIYAKGNINDYDTLLFKYSNIDEERQNKDKDGYVCVFGKNSGCLYNLSVKRGCYNSHKIESMLKEIGELNDNIRFRENIRKFFCLAKKIIENVNNNSIL